MFSNRTIKAVLLSFFMAVNTAVAAEDAAPAPDFTLKDINGKQVALSEHRGKVIFVDFWASWCPPCRNSIPEVEKLYDRYKDERVLVLGINVEGDASAAKKFAASKGMRYTVLVGDQQTARAYKVSGIPAFFIIDPEGKLVQRYTGFQPGMYDQWVQEIDKQLEAIKPTPRPKTSEKKPATGK